MEINEPNYGFYSKFSSSNVGFGGSKTLYKYNYRPVNDSAMCNKQSDNNFHLQQGSGLSSRDVQKSLLNNNLSRESAQSFNPVWVSETAKQSDEEYSICSDEDPLEETPNDVIENSSHPESNGFQASNPRLVTVQQEQKMKISEMTPCTPKKLLNNQATSQENAADSSNTSQNLSSSLSSMDNGSGGSDDDSAQPLKKNMNSSANWKDFLVGLRTGHYETSHTYHHHMDPDAPLLPPEDYGQSDEESESASEKVAKPSKKSKVVEAKEALNKGQEHINAKGKLIRARQMGEGCGKKSCRFKCELRITHEARSNIFNYFWNLGNHQLQWLFIAMHTSVRPPKQRTYKKAPELSRRKTSRSYYFRQGTGKIPVCKTMFLETLDVSDSWVDTAIAKAANGLVVAPDCRGRHSKLSRKTDGEQKGPPTKRSKRRKERIKACPLSSPSKDLEEASPLHNFQQSDQLPATNTENKCDNDSKRKTADFKETNGTLTTEDETTLMQGKLNALEDARDICAYTTCDVDIVRSGRVEVDAKLLSPRVNLQTASDASNSADDGTGMAWSEEAVETSSGRGSCEGTSRLGELSHFGALGGLLGAAAIPEAFRHHLDPETLCLRELPNGAVLRLEGELLEDGVDPSPGSRPAKRRREPARWRANVAKEALNTGQEHVSVKGKLVRARRMGAGCEESCRFKCQERIRPAAREAIFHYFWNLGDHQLQWLFIGRHTRVRAPKHRTQDPARSRRKTTRSYFFTVGQSEVPVCKTMFLRTLDVSDSWVESAILKVAAADGDVAVAADQRGRHRKVARRIPDGVTDSVREHVKLFPRSDIVASKRKRSGDGHSVAEMHRLYVDWMQLDGRQARKVATLRQYRDILTAELKATGDNASTTHD